MGGIPRLTSVAVSQIAKRFEAMTMSLVDRLMSTDER
jgi:hypothetical protein